MWRMKTAIPLFLQMEPEEEKNLLTNLI